MIASIIARPLIPQDIADDARELQVGVLQHLLDAQRVLGDLAHQLLPRPGQIAQVMNGGRRYKLLRIDPYASKSAIHVASFTSLLRPGTLRI